MKMYKDRILKQFGKKKETKIDIRTTMAYDLKKEIKKRVKKRLDYRNKIVGQRKEEKYIYNIDGVKYINHNKKLVKFKLVPVIGKMSNNFLEDYYKELDRKPLSSLDPIHYKIVKNEMIKRNLFNNKKMIKNSNNKFELVNTMAYESLNEQNYGF